jgi:hypothetical protein
MPTSSEQADGAIYTSTCIRNGGLGLCPLQGDSKLEDGFQT